MRFRTLGAIASRMARNVKSSPQLVGGESKRESDRRHGGVGGKRLAAYEQARRALRRFLEPMRAFYEYKKMAECVFARWGRLRAVWLAM